MPSSHDKPDHPKGRAPRQRPAQPIRSTGESVSITPPEPQPVQSELPLPTPQISIQKSPKSSRKAIPNAQTSASIRRTLIPLLLTHGIFLPILGVLWFFMEDDSPFRRVGMAIPLLLIGIGGILMLTGVLNVLYIKNLRKIPPRKIGPLT